jgi:TPR repeat protein
LALLRYEGRAGFESDEKAAIAFGRGWYVGGYSDEERKKLSDADVLIRLARIALEKRGYSKPDLAFRIYQSLALRGNLTGKYAVGVMTLQGNGVAADEVKGKRLLTEVARSKRYSPEAFWAAYLLAEHAYRQGKYRESARLLPDIYGKALVKMALINDNRRPWEIPSDLKDVLTDKAIDLSWTFDLALREGGSGPVGWAVPWKMVPRVKRTRVENRPVLPVEMEAQWTRLLDQTTRKNPELLALVAAAKSYSGGKQEDLAALPELKAARMRGSLLARFALAHFYLSDDDDEVKLRAELGIAQNEELGRQMLEELSKMGVTNYTVDYFK